jgi:outer membrane protein assembly factor BamB
MALDRQTGKTLWQHVAKEELPHEGHQRDNSFASSSPVTDGKHLVVFFGSRGLYCYDLAGNLLWSKDLGRMRTKLSFGEGSSPALYGDTVVITWDHEGDDFIAAFDKNTGAELWRRSRSEDTGWSTPVIAKHGDRIEVVTSNTRKIRAYDLKTGEQLWECSGMTSNAIPTPVAADGLVYVTSGFRGSALLAIRLGRSGDLTGSDAIAWSHARNTPYVPSPLLYGQRLYLLKGNDAILSCFDAQAGKPLSGTDPKRLPELQGAYASPLGADGKVYVTGRNGVTAVLKDGPDLEILATNKLDDRIDASPAAVGRELLLRGHAHLYCISEK